MVSTRTVIGSIGILANHEPLLAMLDPTELRLYRSDSDIVSFAQAEGYLQMIDNHALILVEEALEPGHARCVRRCAIACARPNPRPSRPRRALSGAASRSATSAATRRSCGSPSRPADQLGRVLPALTSASWPSG